MKLLIVDDSVFIRSMIRRYVEKYVDEIIEAADGQQALESFAKYNPDVVFMDIMMRSPREGVDTIVEIRKINSDVKIVVVSSVSEGNPLIDELRKIGITNYVSKPFKADELIEYLK